MGLICAQGAQTQSAKECMYAHQIITDWALPTQGKVYIVLKSTRLQKLISSKVLEVVFFSPCPVGCLALLYPQCLQRLLRKDSSSTKALASDK